MFDWLILKDLLVLLFCLGTLPVIWKVGGKLSETAEAKTNSLANDVKIRNEEAEATAKSMEYEDMEIRADRIVYMCVNSVFQTFVDKLKKNGLFTDDKAEEAKEKAVEAVHELITNDLANYIEESYGNLESWITHRIESYIDEKKK